MDKKNGITRIEICPNMNILGAKLKLSEDMLQGITFYCDDPHKTAIFFDNKSVKMQRNPKDLTGKYSVTISWQKLDYPYG
jgi:hypothetical protein